jgi:hypothetical protein
MRVSMSAMGSVIMSAEPSCEILRLDLERALCRSRETGHSVTACKKHTPTTLPTGLPDARYTALIGKLPETNAACTKLPVHRTWPAAQHATLHLAGGKLRRPLGSGDL